MFLNIFCNVFTAPPPKVEAPAAAPTVPPITIRRPEVMLEDRTESVKGIRKAMVKAMTASLAVPHFGYKDEIILNELVRYGIFGNFVLSGPYQDTCMLAVDTIFRASPGK